jgi:uncharacterized protein YkwD
MPIKIRYTLNTIFMIKVWAILMVAFFSFTTVKNNFFTNETEAEKAFELINKVRQAPNKYKKKYDLGSIAPKPALIWNDNLAKAAQYKANDMAKNNYFAHTDAKGVGMNYYIDKFGYALDKKWIEDPSYNFFESIAAGGTDGEDMVGILLIDSGIIDKAHRKHLLGVGTFNESLVDIGIGFSRTTDSSHYYLSYLCVLIAKHK